MAFTAVKQTFEQTFSDTTNGKSGLRRYMVTSDTKITDNDEVLGASAGGESIPAIRDSWSVSEAEVKVVRRRVTELDNGKTFFLVEVEYETPTGTGVDGSDDPDPTARPWEVTSGTLKNEINIEKTKLDVTGSGLGDIELGLNKSIVNAASDPIEVKGYERTTVLNLSKNYSAFDDIDVSIVTLEDLKLYEGTLNDAVISIASISGSKWTFLIDEINVSSNQENGIDYIRVNYRIIYNPETHVKVLLNAGLNKLIDSGGAKIRTPILNKGVPVKKPALLDVNGNPIAATDPATAVATGTYVAAGVNADDDFSLLGLPTTFN